MQVRLRPTMKIRPHRGTLAAALEEQKEIPASLQAVKDFIVEINQALPFSQAELDSVKIKPYSQSPDTRCGWEDTFIIVYQPHGSENNAVFGFCEKAVED